MLTCYACRRACWKAIFADGLSTLLPALSPGQQGRVCRWAPLRCVSTDAGVARRSVPARMAGSVDAGEGFRRRMASAEQLSGSPDLSKPAGDLESSGRNQNTEIVERTFRRKVATKSRDDGEGPRGRISAYPKAELEKELLYLPDPLKLAENTLNLLRQDEHIKALEIVRYASRKMPCTVSWNHIIDYDMSKGRVTPAMKTYNEVSLLSRAMTDLETKLTALR